MNNKYWSIFFIVVFTIFFLNTAFAQDKLIVAVQSFEASSNTGKISGNFISDRILSNFSKINRFNIVDKDKPADVTISGNVALEEKTITGYKKTSTYSPANLLLGIIYPPFLFFPQTENKPYTENIRNISVSIKAVDAGTNTVVASETITNADLEKIDELSKQICIELLKKYPVKGSVIQIEKDKISVNLGSNNGLRKNDILEIYKPEIVVTSGSTPISSSPEEKIGELQITSVQEDVSYAKIIPHLTKEKVEKDYIIKLVPSETLQNEEIISRKTPKSADPAGMGMASIGQSSGAYAVKSNPAGIAQASKPEIELDWDAHYSSAGINIPNAGSRYAIKDFYGDYNNNPAYPRQFCAVMPFWGKNLGLNLGVSNQRIASNVFNFDDGEVELGLYYAKAVHPDFMIGIGLKGFDRWTGSHRIVNSIDNSYQFRGNAMALEAGLIYRPDSRLGIGATADIGTNYQGKLKTTGSSQSERDFTTKYPQNYGMGLSYKVWDNLTCNLDLLYYPDYSAYCPRAGSELYLTDKISIKGGYYEKIKRLPNFNNDPNYPYNYDLKTSVITGGIGYSASNFSVDLAGEYEFLREQNVLIYPDFTIGSQSRTFLDSYKQARVKVSIGARF